MTTASFHKLVRDFYKKNKRDLPWRNTQDPYRIVVSEIMLQQTQVARVLAKYQEFLIAFPDWKSLAHASNKDVLSVWSGLGYNRRALYLKKIAHIIITEYKGIFPNYVEKIRKLPGVGKATAGSILAFSFNMPTIFIETNIRRVFIHHFFQNRVDISDDEIYPYIKKTLDTYNPREWYYALMDYGSYLVKKIENPNKKSKHYNLQSEFEGSDRQIRGYIIRHLLGEEKLDDTNLIRVPYEKNRVKKVMNDLVKEGIIQEDRGIFSL